MLIGGEYSGGELYNNYQNVLWEQIKEILSKLVIWWVIIITIKLSIVSNLEGIEKYIWLAIISLVLVYSLFHIKQVTELFFWNIRKVVASFIGVYLGYYILLSWNIWPKSQGIWVDIIKLFSEEVTLVPYIELYIYGAIMLSSIVLYIIYDYCKPSPKEKAWFLLSDKPIWGSKNKNDIFDVDTDDDGQEDELWMKEDADWFARLVYNDWGTESFVFGLVAPWWYGKSSFLNLFKKSKVGDKENQIQDETIIFEFNPWYFESDNDLLTKFLQQFSWKVNNDNLLSDRISQLVNFVGSEYKWPLSMIVSMFHKKKDLSDIKDDINIGLRKLNKKVVIIIDDLDRISDTKLKSIFKIVDLCKDFYNTSFILCYDPNNFNNIEDTIFVGREKDVKTWEIDRIISHDVDHRYLIDYIAKVVNVEYHLLPKFDRIQKYFKNVFINWTLSFSKRSKIWIEAWIDKLFLIDNYRIWGKYISDIRGIKRLYNHFLTTPEVGELEDIFHDSKWIEFDTLLKFLILKLTHNHLYKHILFETSLSSDRYSDGDNQANIYKYLPWTHITHKTISPKYKEYIDWLGILESLLIESLFYSKINIKDSNSISHTKGSIWYSGLLIIERLPSIWLWLNLNKYILLAEYKDDIWFNVFILNKLNDFHEDMKDLFSIMEEIYDRYNNKWVKLFGDTFLEELWYWHNALLKTKEYIDYKINNGVNSNINNGLRSLHLDIEILLNESAKKLDDKQYVYDLMYWIDRKIWIFDIVFQKYHKVLALYINLGFMHWLYKDTKDKFPYYIKWMLHFPGNDLSSQRSNMNACWVRLSQIIFKWFKTNYIDHKKNIFADILNLDDKYVWESEEGSFLKTRQWIVSFIIFQLTTSVGNFDDYTNDESKWNDYENHNWWIKEDLQKYYFETCFIGEWIKYFIDYVASFCELERDYQKAKNKKIILPIDKPILVLWKENVRNILSNRIGEINDYIEENEWSIVPSSRYHSSEEWNVELVLTYREFWDFFEEEIKEQYIFNDKN